MTVTVPISSKQEVFVCYWQEQVCLVIGAWIFLNACLYLSKEVICRNLSTK